MTHRCNRRDLLKSASSVVAAQLFPAPAVLADPAPGAKLNLAAIGCGGRSLYLDALRPEVNFVALADPDEGNLARALKNLAAGAEKAKMTGFDPTRIKTFSDYRAMLDKMHMEIDAVLIATPDHQHACPSMMAIKLGKHVFCEKPLVHHIAEARALADAARQAKVATQMGNQGSGTGGHQTLAEYLEAGAIGKLQEVHAWHVFASRFGGIMPKPKPQPVPKGLDWDAWLGPARERPFSSVYRPWHGWFDFGTGSLGGHGTHVMDAAYFALKPGHPTRVELLEVGEASEDRFPRWSTVRYDLPQQGDIRPISVFWYEGSRPNRDGMVTSPDGKPVKTIEHRPPLVVELEKKYGRSFGGRGSIFVGDKGVIFSAPVGGATLIFPESRRKEFTPPPKKLARPSGGIMGDFLRACKAGGGPTFSGFATFAGPFLEMLLVAHLAMRAGLNRPIQWDGANMKCTNRPELNQYVSPDYRKGWTL